MIQSNRAENIETTSSRHLQVENESVRVHLLDALKLGLRAALASGSRKRAKRAIDTAVIVPAGFPCSQSYRPISPSP